ncbi:hypothetical protein GYA49_01545 [Candidatus Beckwithbacteria bacterium]|nr:hypothetical protein [Candidatus Beckwithbacteria bacterium]
MNKTTKLVYLRFVLISCLFLTACNPSINLDQLKNLGSQKPEDTISQGNINSEDILKADRLVALVYQNKLYLADPDYPKPYPIYEFKHQEQPVRQKLDTFEISPDKQWVVWYTPGKGVLALDTSTKKVQVVNQPSDFLNTNPYFEFDQGNNLYFITNNGNTLVKTNLTSGERSSVAIPYPYGNVFKVSPDQQHILFISGYGQTEGEPQFMFTDNSGNFLVQFTTKTNLADRHQVIWTPDSRGVAMINGQNLEYYSVNDPNSAQVLFSVGEGDRILNINRVGNDIYLFTSQGYWHVYDYAQGKEVARTPIAIAKELNSPVFYPWKEKQLLIEETLPEGEAQFNRLWVSDLKGNKKMVMDKYHEVIVKTQLQDLD